MSESKSIGQAAAEKIKEQFQCGWGTDPHLPIAIAPTELPELAAIIDRIVAERPCPECEKRATAAHGPIIITPTCCCVIVEFCPKTRPAFSQEYATFAQAFAGICSELGLAPEEPEAKRE